MMEVGALLGGLAAFLLAMGGLYHVFIDRQVGRDRKRVFVEQTRLALFGGERESTRARRQMISDRLEELNKAERKRGEEINRAAQLKLGIERSGLEWSEKNYRQVQVAIGVATYALLVIVTGNFLIVVPFALITGYMLPGYYLEGKIKQRQLKFSDELPNALDVLVRGARAGLPVAECIRTVAKEAAEPVKTEFEMVVQAQNLGATLTVATEMLADRIPIADTRFLAIAVSIQETEGGAIADTLGNLSNTLRERRKLNEKVQAMGSSARSSARALAAMPFLLLGLTYYMDPDRTQVLWTTHSGQIVTAACVTWVIIGFFVLKKMQDNSLKGA